MHKLFPNLEKKFNKINNSIIVVGGGLWALIILQELLLNFKQLKEIIIVTNNNEILKNFSNKQKKKIKLNNNFDFLKKKNKHKFAIIANSNKDHFSTSKLLIQNSLNLLVEKPLVENISQYKYLLKLSKAKKCKIFVSMPFYFSYYFYYFKKKYLKNRKYKIYFEWHDEINEIRDGILKKHDFSINYVQDTIYHFYGILACLYGKKKIIYIDSINKKNSGFLKVKYGKNIIYLNCSRKKKNKRVREIIFKSNLKKYVINYSNDNEIRIIYNGKRKKLNLNFCQKTLKFQLYYFLNFRKVKDKFLLNDINKINDLIKLKFNMNN